MTENESNQPEQQETNAANEAPGSEAASENTTQPVPGNEGQASASSEAASDESHEGEEEGDEEGEGAEGEGDGAAGLNPDGTPKKKRRRRRRKKKGAQGEGGAESGQRAPAHGAFGSHDPSKKHPFSSGDIVAGVVVRIEDGAALVDLFGKSMAIVDVLEPREIEALPEPPAPAAQPEGTQAAEGAPSEVAQTEGAPAEDAPQTTSAGDVAAEAEHEEAAAAVEAEAEHAHAAEEESHDHAEEQAAKPSIAVAPAIPLELGQVFRGRVISVSESGHIALVNRAIDRAKARATIGEAAAARRRVEGVVYGYNRGGFDVIVEGIRTFCPASGMSLSAIPDPNVFVGRKLEFTLPPSKGGRSIVISRRALLERERRKAIRDRMKALAVGTRMHGKILDVRDYGILVDLGDGLDGLVHLSEVSWSRGVRPSDVGKRGDDVEVEVLKVTPASRKERHGRISLSIRACLPDPWDQHKDILEEGHAQKAKIVRTTEFGCFVELAPGVEGLLHISELGNRDIRHANQVVKEGDEIGVLVERVDRRERKLALSKLSPTDLAAVEAGTYQGGKGRAPKPGSIVTVVIEKVEHHGLFVQVEGVPGRRGRGYLSNKELGEVSSDRRRQFVQGAKLEVKVTGTDRDGGLRCSIRARQADEERNAVKEYRREAATKGFGTFGDLLRAKLEK